MSEPFVGEIRAFGFNFAPRGWAQCNGQLLAISANSALFSLLGTIYGGDGRTTFGLPDLRGRFATNYGQGPGLSSRSIGQQGGTEQNYLTIDQMPSHSHAVSVHVADDDATTNEVDGTVLANSAGNTYSTAAPDGTLSPNAATSAPMGNNQATNNMPPFLAVNYCIALVGIYPSRS